MELAFNNNTNTQNTTRRVPASSSRVLPRSVTSRPGRSFDTTAIGGLVGQTNANEFQEVPRQASITSRRQDDARTAGGATPGMDAQQHSPTAAPSTATPASDGRPTGAAGLFGQAPHASTAGGIGAAAYTARARRHSTESGPTPDLPNTNCPATCGVPEIDPEFCRVCSRRAK